jgi:hypothetical protein
MVEQSGEPFLLPFFCCLPHTVPSLSCQRCAVRRQISNGQETQLVARQIRDLSGSPSFVAVVQSADLRYRYDRPHGRGLNGSVVRASPSPTRDGFSIGDSNENTN